MRLLQGRTQLAAKKPSPVEVDYESVFRTDSGGRVLRDLMQRNFIWSGTFDESAVVMAHNEGRRDVILYIMEMARKKMELPTEYADTATEAEMDYMPSQREDQS